MASLHLTLAILIQILPPITLSVNTTVNSTATAIINTTATPTMNTTAMPTFNSTSPPLCDYYLSQIDFDFGTYRIRNYGVYCLTENIVFNPLPPDQESSAKSPNSIDPFLWFPKDNESYPGCISLENGPFALGFFSVITIESSNVIIDLQGYEIKYSYSYYLQQRWGSIIEISNSPFLPSTGPAEFGGNFQIVNNITICNGTLGLSSHHGIHGNDGTNIVIKDIKIYNFEVAGIQLNGFHGAQILNVDIGPSLHNVSLTAYYSNARNLLLSLTQLLEGIAAHGVNMPTVSYSYLSESESLSLTEVRDNLAESMDIIYRYYTGDELTDEELQSMELYHNYDGLPDGGALYGIALKHGEDVYIENVTITDMTLNTNEVIGVSFEECHNQNYQPQLRVTQSPTEYVWTNSPTPAPTLFRSQPDNLKDFRQWYIDYYYYLYGYWLWGYAPDDGCETFNACRRRRMIRARIRSDNDHSFKYNKNEYDSVSHGPFGEVMDITKMIPPEQVELITADDGSQDLSELEYTGNPLSDAQIALYAFGKYLSNYNHTNYGHTSFISIYFLEWAVGDYKFPSECVNVSRNRDNMHQPNTGVIGVRMDWINDAKIRNISIGNLYNRASAAYDDEDGVLLTNTRGISVYDTDLFILGGNQISNLNSWYGIAEGLDIMDDSGVVIYHDEGILNITDVISKSQVKTSNDAKDVDVAALVLIPIGILLICVGVIWFYRRRTSPRREVRFEEDPKVRRPDPIISMTFDDDYEPGRKDTISRGGYSL